MVETDAAWMDIIATKIGDMGNLDFAIVACIACIPFFMKYNKHESKNKANQFISISLGIGFLMLVGARIFKG